MPFDNGTVTLTIFDLPSPLPDNAVECFSSNKAGTLDSVSGEPGADPQIGWVTGRHLLDTQIDEGTAYRGPFMHLTLRKAERRLPAALLNAICRREEFLYRQAHDAEFVPAKVRRSIKESAVARHLPQMPPSLSSVSFALDPRNNALYLGTASASQIDFFIENFYHTVKVEPVQLTPGVMLEKTFHVTEASFPAMSFGDATEEQTVVGRDFLTWLWYYSEHEGKIDCGEDGEFDLFIEGPLTLAYAAEANGAEETVIKKGNSPQRSAEAKAALAVGKKLKKAKFSLVRGEDIWSGTMDADHFSFGSMKLPEGEAVSPDEHFIERIESLAVFKTALEKYFSKFAETVLSAGYPETEKELRRWAAERDGI